MAGPTIAGADQLRDTYSQCQYIYAGSRLSILAGVATMKYPSPRGLENRICSTDRVSKLTFFRVMKLCKQLP